MTKELEFPGPQSRRQPMEPSLAASAPSASGSSRGWSRHARRRGAYLPSVAPKRTNERQRRRERCSSARHRDTGRAAPRSTAGLPRRKLATGSEVARNWYPSDPCPIKRVAVLPCLSSPPPFTERPGVPRRILEWLSFFPRSTLRRRGEARDSRGSGYTRALESRRDPLARRLYSRESSSRIPKSDGGGVAEGEGQGRERARFRGEPRVSRRAPNTRRASPPRNVTSGGRARTVLGEESRVPFLPRDQSNGQQVGAEKRKGGRAKRRGCGTGMR